MARQSQYTQPVTKSPTFKRITGEDKSIWDQAVEGLGIYKEFREDKLNSNLTLIKDQAIFDKAQHKSFITNLGNYANIQKIVQDTYGGDVEAWARVTAKTRRTF